MKLLTPREMETLKWVIAGKTGPEVAEILCISLAAIDKRMRQILRKLGAHTRAQAVAEAFRHGLVE